MKKLITIIGIIAACMTLQAQNVMQLNSNYESGTSLDISEVYSLIDADVIDTLYKYKDNLSNLNRCRTKEIINLRHANLITNVNNLVFPTTPLVLTFAEVIIYGSNKDIKELAIRLNAERDIASNSYNYAQGDKIKAYHNANNQYYDVVIESLPANNYSNKMIVRKVDNNALILCDYYYILKKYE